MGIINIFQEAERCLMCQDAPCGKKVADAIRAIRFENPARAKGLFEGENLEEAQKACIHYDLPLRIREMADATSPAATAVTRPLRLKNANPGSWATSA